MLNDWPKMESLSRDYKSLKGHTSRDGSAHPPRIISLIWIPFPQLEVKWKHKPHRIFLPPRWITFQIQSPALSTTRARPKKKNDLFGKTTLILCHFGKMKSVRTATNKITGPEENSASCEMMFSDHLNETDEKAVYEQRLSPCVRAMCTSAEYKASGCKVPNLGCVCRDMQIWILIYWYI